MTAILTTWLVISVVNIHSDQIVDSSCSRDQNAYCALSGRCECPSPLPHALLIQSEPNLFRTVPMQGYIKKVAYAPVWLLGKHLLGYVQRPVDLYFAAEKGTSSKLTASDGGTCNTATW